MAVTLRQWLRDARPAQVSALARYAKTSVVTLRHIAVGFRKGSAKAAIRIAAAADKVDDAPAIAQGSICPACKTCRFYKPD